MSNATSNLVRNAAGGTGVIFDLPIAASTHIYEGTLVAQKTGNGNVLPYSSASSDVCVGVAQHEADNSAGADGALRLRIETGRTYIFANGTAGDAFADTDMIGALVYATDDHTLAKTSSTEARAPVGFFMGLEATSGNVRAHIDPALARVVYQLQHIADAPATVEALRTEIVQAFG